jgi:hypothetical protein
MDRLVRAIWNRLFIARVGCESQRVREFVSAVSFGRASEVRYGAAISVQRDGAAACEAAKNGTGLRSPPTGTAIAERF